MKTRSNAGEQEFFYETLFYQWSEGLTDLESRIAIFYHIRDIPYAIIPEWQGKDTVRMMIEYNKGWCGPKHYLLRWMYDRLELPVRYVMIPFRWEEQPVHYPAYIQEYIADLSDSTHLLCQIEIQDQWLNVDATWDLPLQKAGFPVNKNWDGISHTLPAVIRKKTGSLSPSEVQKRRKKNPDFAFDLNRWLETLRNETQE